MDGHTRRGSRRLHAEGSGVVTLKWLAHPDATVTQNSPAKGDAYSHPDGTDEVVFAVEAGTVLTFREYPDVETFTRETERATYRGRDSAVESLPSPQAIRGDSGPTPSDGTTRGDGASEDGVGGDDTGLDDTDG